MYDFWRSRNLLVAKGQNPNVFIPLIREQACAVGPNIFERTLLRGWAMPNRAYEAGLSTNGCGLRPPIMASTFLG